MMLSPIAHLEERDLRVSVFRQSNSEGYHINCYSTGEEHNLVDLDSPWNKLQTNFSDSLKLGEEMLAAHLKEIP